MSVITHTSGTYDVWTTSFTRTLF